MNMWNMENLLFLMNLILSLRISMSEAVREYRPSDDTSKAEILALKTMLSSMQGSLITSVGLIQGTYILEFIVAESLY